MLGEGNSATLLRDFSRLQERPCRQKSEERLGQGDLNDPEETTNLACGQQENPTEPVGDAFTTSVSAMRRKSASPL
jgi:hypothetical protein